MHPTDHITIEGRKPRFKHISLLLTIVTLGLYPLLTKLIPKLSLVQYTHSNLRDATHLQINTTLVKIQHFYFPFSTTKLINFVSKGEIRYFDHNFVRFFFDNTKNKFVLYKDVESKAHLEKLVKSQQESNRRIMKDFCVKYQQKKFSFDAKYTVSRLYVQYFLTDVALLEKYIVYGENSTEQKPKSHLRLLVDIVISPIFLYTMAGVVLWMNIEYEFNAFIILAMTGYSLVVDFMEEVRKKREIQKMSHKRDVLVHRHGSWAKVPHTAIFPGDVISVDTGNDFVCDVRLFKGEVIVDESFLTGETVPVFKSCDSVNNIIYAGTKVLKTLGVRTLHEKKNIIPDIAQLKSEVIVKSIKKKNLKSEDARKNKKNRKKDDEEATGFKNETMTVSIADSPNEAFDEAYEKDYDSTMRVSDEPIEYNLGDTAKTNDFDDIEKTKEVKDFTQLNNNIKRIEAINESQTGHTNNNIQNKEENNKNQNNLKNNITQNKEQKYEKQTDDLKSSPSDKSSPRKTNPEEKECMSRKSDSSAVGVVVSTRYETAKGRLIKNILTETPINFTFERQCMQTIKCTLFMAFVLVSVLFAYLLYRSIGLKDSFCYSIDLIFCIMSPTLPATIWIGASMSAQRLRVKNIRCNDAQRINLAGKSDIVVFDKTGTLTEEGLDVFCIDDIENEYFSLSELSNNICDKDEEAKPKQSIYNNDDEPEEATMINTNIPIIRECLSVCHSVYLVDNELVGDPLDIKMFIYAESTIVNTNNKRVIRSGVKAAYEGPILKELKDVDSPIYHYQDKSVDVNNAEGIEILKIFEFDNKLRRMSVITKRENGKGHKVYVKGSPESVHDLLREVPEDYDDTVKDHALDGFRVLALAYKDIECGNSKNGDIGRTEAESELSFLGFIVFANKLKGETKVTLKELNKVGIKTLMATGDNILTAVSVGRQSKIIDKFTPVIFPLIDENAKSIYDAQWLCIGEDGLVFDKIKLSLHKGEDRISYSDFLLACEGREYEIIRQESKEYFDFLLSRGVIFARMNPDQKKLLVEDLNNIGYSTVFCGDGANDCGALKSAHIGIALAENEASIASTFISTVKNISCVLSVIKEGRCALMTSFSRFQFMLLTCYIQFISLYVLSFMKLFLSDKQTAHFDILIVLPFAYFMTGFKPNTQLSKFIPQFKLFARNEVIRVIGHIVISTIFIGLGIVSCMMFHDGSVPTEDEGFLKASPTGLCIFFITTFQVIVLGYLFSSGKPHRQSRLTNAKYMLFFIATALFTILLLIMCIYGMEGYIFNTYQFVEIDKKSKIALVLNISLNTIITIFFDGYIKNDRDISSDDNDEMA